MHVNACINLCVLRPPTQTFISNNESKCSSSTLSEYDLGDSSSSDRKLNAFDMYDMIDTLRRLPSDCEWALSILSSTFVNVAAIQSRLNYGFPVDGLPLVFTRMSGRLSRIFVYVNRDPVFFGLVRSGILVNRAFLNRLAKLDVRDISQKSFDNAFMTDGSLVSGEESVSPDGVDFRPEDVVLSLFLYRKLGVRISNWASFLDHYILGSSDVVSSKIRIRSQLRSPCILVAHPVHFFTKFLHDHVRNCCLTCVNHSMEEVQYSWQNYASSHYSSESYYHPWISEPLGTHTDYPLTVSPIAPWDCGTEFLAESYIVLSTPGGGTTWLFSILQNNIRASGNMTVEADLLHPYVQNLYRGELSLVFSAGEDSTRNRLMKESCENCPLIPVLLGEVSDRRPFLTKEVMNVFRSLDMMDMFGTNILLLYRSRQYTFPTVGQETCRMCFYTAFYDSMQTNALTLPWLDAAKQFVVRRDPESIEVAVLMHTVLWRYILWRVPPRKRRIVHYSEILTAEDPLQSFEETWLLSYPFDPAGVSSEIIRTRNAKEWLNSRVEEYQKLNIEGVVSDLLTKIRKLDPETDDSLLNLQS